MTGDNAQAPQFVKRYCRFDVGREEIVDHLNRTTYGRLLLAELDFAIDGSPASQQHEILRRRSHGAFLENANRR